MFLHRPPASFRRPHIIVVPSSVLDNWDSELKKFCPALKLVKYHGSQKDRSAIRQRLNRVSSGADREGMPVRERQDTMLLLSFCRILFSRVIVPRSVG